MSRHHPYKKEEHGSGHTDLPMAPGAERSQRLILWGRQRGYVSKSSKEDNVAEMRGRREESHHSHMDQLLPVADRPTARRKDYTSLNRVNLEDVKVKVEETERETTNFAFPLFEVEREPRDHTDSPGMFVRRDTPEPHPEDRSELTSEPESDTDVSAYGDIVEGSLPGEELPSEEEDREPCRCPINLQCPRRANNLIDCRSLVPERDWAGWNAIAQGNATLNAIVPPVDAGVTTAERVGRILQYFDRVKVRRAGHDADRADYRRMVEWAVEMQTHSVTQALLNDTQILALLQSFLTPVNPAYHLQKRTPLNLLEELRIIFKKWSRGDLLADANRGLLLVTKMSVAGRPYTRLRIDNQWEHRMRDTFYGNGHLVNGQRWQLRIQLSRDGGHGPHEAGIAGSILNGARSIVMGSHDKYADVDMGDRIYYYGTALPKLNIPNDPEPVETNIKDTAASSNRGNREETHGTKCLRRSLETGTPVRVFRSYKLSVMVRHKPIEGYRYDGLYRVTQAKLDKKDRQIIKFTMRRLCRNDPASDGQGPLRGVRVQGA